MTKIYHLDKKARASSRRGVMFASLTLFLVGSLVFGLLRGFSSFFQGGAVHLWKIKDEVVQRANQNFDSATKPKRILVAENEALRNEIESLYVQIANLQGFEAENIELKSILGRNSQGSLLFANVLTSPMQSIHKTITLDVGEDHGVQVGEVVLSHGSLALGKVVSIFKKTSTVELFSSVGTETQMFIEKGNVAVTVVGAGGSQLRFDAPRDLEVKKGDLLLYPGAPYFVSGIIENVEFDARDSVKKVLVRLPDNPNELRWLEIFSN